MQICQYAKYVDNTFSSIIVCIINKIITDLHHILETIGLMFGGNCRCERRTVLRGCSFPGKNLQKMKHTEKKIIALVSHR